MKGALRFSTGLFVVLFSTLSIASMHSSTIPLDSERIEPGKTLFIKTEPLFYNLHYTISCDLENLNPKAENTSDLMINLSKNHNELYFGEIRVDDKSIFLNKPTHFRSTHSTITVTKVTKEIIQSINFYNLDYSDTYKITCAGNLEFE